jgi:hypothetical protein
LEIEDVLTPEQIEEMQAEDFPVTSGDCAVSLITWPDLLEWIVEHHPDWVVDALEDDLPISI